MKLSLKDQKNEGVKQKYKLPGNYVEGYRQIHKSLTSAVFWDIAQRRVVISNRKFSKHR